MNPELAFTLDDAVAEVLGNLTGLDLTYDPQLERYGTITRQLNRALRGNALEQEWSYYATVLSLGPAVEGARSMPLPEDRRPRVINDDAVRLVDADGTPRVWSYFLPRDAVHKYAARPGLWCAVTVNTLNFSRPFLPGEAGLDVQIPVMREPVMFRLPDQPEDPNLPLVPVPDIIRNQEIDFAYPDVITARAAFYYAQTDPVMQPRVQMLESLYKDLMYQAMERDERNTDTPFQNDWFLAVQNGIYPESTYRPWPVSDPRR